MQVWSVPPDWLGSWKLKGNKKTCCLFISICCYSTFDEHFPRLLGVCWSYGWVYRDRDHRYATPLHNLTSHQPVGVLVCSFMHVSPRPPMLLVRVSELRRTSVHSSTYHQQGQDKEIEVAATFADVAVIFVQLLQQARQSLTSTVLDQSTSELQSACFHLCCL
jgi:hypothetical protein